MGAALFVPFRGKAFYPLLGVIPNTVPSGCGCLFPGKHQAWVGRRENLCQRLSYSSVMICHNLMIRSDTI